MEQRLFIRHMMKTLKNIVLENKKIEYTVYKYSSTIDFIASGLSVLCDDDVRNLNFDMGFEIIRSSYKITMLCGCAYQGKNAVIIENLKTSKTIGQIIDRERERGTYNATVEICDEIIRRNKRDNNESLSEIHSNMKKYRTAYEDAVKGGFTGSEQEFLTSARLSPWAMDFMPLKSIDCNMFEQICECNQESKSIPEASIYSTMYQDMIDSIDVRKYTNKISNLFDSNCVADMSKVLDSLMPILEKCGLLESISNEDELANLVRGAFYEYKYNADSILNFNIETGSIDSFLGGAAMLKLLLSIEDKIEELKEFGKKFDAESFIMHMYNILLRLKTSSYSLDRVGFEINTTYLLEHVKFEINITQERTIQLFDITAGHEKLILFSADISEILEDKDYNIQPYIPLTGTSEKLEDELALFTLVMTQNQLFLSKLVEVSFSRGNYYHMDMPFELTSLEENILKNNNSHMRRDDLPAFSITSMQDIQLNDDEIRRRYNQIDDSEDDDNK
mgnify:CR=1 FL=1